jgi:hypothetical protein
MPAVSMLYFFPSKLLFSATNLAVSIIGVLSALLTKSVMSVSSSRALLVVLALDFGFDAGNRLMCDGDWSLPRSLIEGSFSFPNLIAHLFSIKRLA